MIKLPPDYHTHTHLCRHAGGVPADYAAAALRLGIPEMACTDHIPFPNDVEAFIRMLPGEFQDYLDLVRQAQQQAGEFPILLGLEADYLPEWETNYLREFLEQTPFDLVLGSVHTGPFWDLRANDPRATPDFVEDMWRTYFCKVTELAHSRLYDIVAHLDLVKRGGCRIPEERMKNVICPALDAIAKADMAVEINTSGLSHAAEEMYPSTLILSWMHERGIPITFGSDAHAPEQVGQHFEQAVQQAIQTGYTHSAIFRQRQRSLRPLAT